MEIRSREIRKRWRQGSMPNLRHRWLFDRKYWLDDVDELKEVISACRPVIEPYVQFRGEYGDCDDHALFLIAEIRKRYIDKAMAGDVPAEQRKPRPVGRAMGSQFRGMQLPHALCIAETKQGTYLFEGHEDRIWKKDKDNDSVFFVSV